MARKSKYTPDVVQRLTLAIGLGATYELACNYAGISYDTFRIWLNTKPAFFDTIKQAEGQGVTKWLAKIEQAATDGNWQAAAWKLERRYPKDYGRRDYVRHDDWRSEAIADIRAGRITYEALARAFDDSLATELFRSAGVMVSSTEGT